MSIQAATRAQMFFKGTELESLPVNEAENNQENTELTFSDFSK